MSGFSVDFSGMKKLTDDVAKISNSVHSKGMSAVMVAAEKYASDVQAKLPWVTHTLIRSVHVVPENEYGQPIAYVGSNAPYARRIEHGFVGMDKLKRVYNQPPNLVWRPVFDNNKAVYGKLITQIIQRGEE